jgi:glutamate formiminotransferase/formiminotetrahydrofolate cyclodeaminase
MEECVVLAEKLAKRVGEELKIPVYLYANAAKRPDRQSLADVRKGEYEALPSKMLDDSYIPDYGPREFNASAGATVIGARPFLLAYNVNLNTRSKKLANEIALNIREAGRAKKDGDGKAVKDGAGNAVKVPGTLKACRAVGWYVDEYERAQVSINLIDHKVTALHQAFEACCEEATKLGLRVTGSEIVGLVPLEPVLDAGRFYLRKQGRSTGVSETELVTAAIQSLGLSDLSPFERNSKIIEYKVRSSEKVLTDKTVAALVDELASESPAPGGGSVSALCGALSAGLSSMVANLTFDKKGFEKQKSLMDETANKAQRLKEFFVKAVDDDTAAFNQIVAARRMAKNNADEIQRREQAIFEANVQAIKVPMSILQSAEELLSLAEILLRDGNQNSLSDAGCAVLNAVAAGEGAYMNVLINLAGLSTDGSEGDFRKTAYADSELSINRLRKHASILTDETFGKLKNALPECSIRML